MIEVQIYAEGIREMSRIMNLGHELELYSPQVRYQVDRDHEVVYLEIETDANFGWEEIQMLFKNIEITPRLIGSIPEGW